ncbi:dihydrofolate reductase family protein [Methanobacterium sp. ACI-7]|uniref:dihydrofolate reductase family protein n=1 Tax=unclassified Methanobacterium TaxID=2627676 RepID=UPI0039C3BD7A
MLPKIILYNAVSLDGRINGFNADVGLYYELASNWDIDAVLMGSNTVLAGFDADSKESSEDLEFIKNRKKYSDDSRPYLIVPDSNGKIRIWNELFKMPYLRDIIVLCSKTTPEEYLNFLNERNIDFIISGEDKVDLKVSIQKLSSNYGIKSIRVDSGGILNGILLRAGLADEIHVLIHPELVGGMKENSLFQAADINSLNDVISLKLVHIKQLRKDIIWLKYEIIK